MIKFVIISFFVLSSNVFADLSVEEVFKMRLLSASPSYGGEPLRSVEAKDLDRDGINEILFKINPLKERSIDLVNDELAPALAWIDVYGIERGEYNLRTSNYRMFLLERQAHYQKWIKKLQDPKSLSQESKALIEKNQQTYLLQMYENLERIKDLLNN